MCAARPDLIMGYAAQRHIVEGRIGRFPKGKVN
jgi:hypothetical protein